MSEQISNTAGVIKAAFESLAQETLANLLALYAENTRFKDPFNDVSGRAGVEKIFAHMFHQVQTPRFVVTRVIDDAASGNLFMRWDFTFVSSGKPMHIHGATHFERDATGLITLHRDYWDAAEELYEKLPLIGVLMRWLRRKLSV